jgi:glycosyltransferase involved in cell wall biosynthesis
MLIQSLTMTDSVPIFQNQERPAFSKIVFSLPSGFMVSGITTWSVEMTRYINLRDQDAILIRHTPYPGYPEVLYPNLQSLNVLECPGDTPYSISRENILPQYKAIYGQLSPATFVPNWGPSIYSVCAALAKEDPNKLRVIGYAHSDEPYYYETLQYFEPIIYAFIAVSQDVGNSLGKFIPSRKKDILVYPCPVRVPKELTRNYTISPDRPLKIVYAGRLQSKQKRVYDLVLLAKRLIDKGVNFHLFICGNGPEEQNLRNKMRTISHTPNKYVTFVGTVSPDNMLRVWKNADICILVSDFEGTSISMLEAMASGCVPIVTKTSGVQKFIRSQDNGFVVDIGNIEKITRIVERLDSNRSLLSKIGYQAYKTLQKHYTYDNYVSWFLQLSKEIWRQPSRYWPTDRPIYFS